MSSLTFGNTEGMSMANCDTSALKADIVIPLGKFSHGTLKQKHNVNFSIKYEEGSNQRKRRRILTAETDRLKYVGKGGEDLQDDTARYYLGVYDEEFDDVVLYNAELFNLHPQIEGQGDEVEEATNKTYWDKLTDLNKAFGSEKVKRSIDAKKRNIVSAEVLKTSVGAAVEQVISSQSLDDNAGTIDVYGYTDLIPPYNPNATKDSETYTIDRIISKEEMLLLEIEAEIFIRCTREDIDSWKSLQKYPSFIIYHLYLLPLEETARRLKASVLMYMNFLLMIYKIKKPSIKLMPFDEKMPKIVYTLLDKFTYKEVDIRKRGMPTRLQDSLKCYILVMALIMEDFNLDCTLIANDLNLKNISLHGYLRALGCNVKKQKLPLSTDSITERHVATVPIPFKFPTELFKKQRKR